MKDSQKISNLLRVGLDSQLAHKAIRAGYTKTKLRQANKSELANHFTDEELEKILAKVKRKPIPKDILQRLVEECDWKCCMCRNFHEANPVVIHHIEEHSKTQDDSYDNLVLLCLNHHAKAHSKWEISRHPLPPQLLRTRKQEWINDVKKYKTESRPTSDQKYISPLAWNQEPSILVIGHRLDADVECVLWSETEPNVADYDIVIMDLTIERKPLLPSYRPRQIHDPQFDISNYLTWTHTRNRIESLILSGGTIFIIADSGIVRHLDAPRKFLPDKNSSLLPFILYGEQTPAGKSISFVDPQFGSHFHNLGTWNFIFSGHIDLNFESTPNHTCKVYPIAKNKANEILGISIRVDSHKSSKPGWIHVLPKPTSIASSESIKLLVKNFSKHKETSFGNEGNN